jgi:hypothetical protein
MLNMVIESVNSCYLSVNGNLMLTDWKETLSIEIFRQPAMPLYQCFISIEKPQIISSA